MRQSLGRSPAPPLSPVPPPARRIPPRPVRASGWSGGAALSVSCAPCTPADGLHDNLKLWMQFGFALPDNRASLAAFDLDELTAAVRTCYPDAGADAVRRWQAEVSTLPGTREAGPLAAAGWMRANLFTADLAACRASDKLDEALFWAFGLLDVSVDGGDNSGDIGDGGGDAARGIATRHARTDAMMVHLLRSRLGVLRSKLSANAMLTASAGDGEGEHGLIGVLRVVVASEAEAAARALAAIERHLASLGLRVQEQSDK